VTGVFGFAARPAWEVLKIMKYRRLLGAVFVCAMVGVAYGAANKIKSFAPQGSELSTADGMAMLNFANGHGGKTIRHLMITGFTPFTSYDVEFRSPTAGSWFAGGILVTDQNGDAKYKDEFPGLDISDSDLYIYVNLGQAGEELRAVGLQ